MAKKQAGARSRAAAAKKSAEKKSPAKGKTKAGAKQEPTPSKVEPEEEELKPVRNIQKHADREVRKAFSKICEGLIEKAKTGAMGETKLLMKISRLDEPQPGRKRRGKTLSGILLEELEKAKAESGVSESGVSGSAG